MTNSLRDALDDLVGAVPDHVVRDDLPAAAWTAGRRRRLRRRLVNGALAAAAVLVAAVVVVPMVQDVRSLPPASDEPGPGVASYPQRIGHQWWVRDLPDRPGPAAGLIQIYPGGDRLLEWHVVSPSGHRWRLDRPYRHDIFPTTSPNGRYVGYIASEAGPYVIHDLASGTRVEFAGFSVGLLADDLPLYDTPYVVSDQSPSFWSPSGNLVWIPAFAWADSEELRSELILGVDGSMTQIERNASLGFAAGWASGSELVFVQYHYVNPETFEPPVQKVTATITDLDGNVIRTMTLDLGRPWETEFGNQWGAVVSPDGTQIVVNEEIDSWSYRLHRFDLSNASPTGEPTDAANLEEPCGLGWTDEGVTVPIRDLESSNATTALADSSTIRPIVAVEPGIKSRCLIWASDAISGEARGGLFGLSPAWWTWWWREIVAALLLVGLPLAGWLRRRAYRSTSRYTSTDSALPLT
jgi:hypothetical protein